MAEGLMEPSRPSLVPNGPVDVASEVAAAVASSDSLFSRRIQFHLERKPYSPISSSLSQNFYLETLNPSSTTPQRPGAMAAAGPAPSSLAQSVKVSDGGLDPELSFRITFRRIGAGLQNLGNTCFLNSVLQCLTYTEPFAAYLQSGKHKSSCRTAGFCAMCAIQNHVMNALQSSGKILSPLHLVKNLRCISRNFRNSRQEDAHEYMVNLLESMHKCCIPSGVPTESPSAYEKSLVHKIFGGRLRSQVKCTQCQYCSNKFEPFLDLSLEIVKADSLRKALAHFTAVEQLDGGEKQYQCQRCKEKVRAYKQLTVHKAPHVLTIHLKRFGPTGEKIDRKVEFQPTLDLKPFVSDPHEAELTYTLYGVLVHAGWSTRSGHYYCFVRTSSGMWHSLDDNQVLQVSEKTVLAQKAYMLFYVRNRSSTIKRTADAAQYLCATASGNKVRSSSVINGTIQNIERKSTFSECSLAKSRADNPSNGHPVTVVGKSSGVPLANGGVSLQKSINIIPKETRLLHSNGHSTSIVATCLQRNGEVSSDGMQQTALLNVSKNMEDSSIQMPLASSSSHNQKLMETLDHLSHLRGDIIVHTSHVDNTCTHENDQKVQEKSKSYISSNGKVKTIVLTQQNPDNCGSLNSSFDKCSKSLLEERSIHMNGIATSRVSDIPCMNGGSSSVNKELITSTSQLNHTNGSTAKQHFNTVLAEHQSTGSENDKHTSGMQYQKRRESHKKLEDTSVKVLVAEEEVVSAKERYNSVGRWIRSELKKEKHLRSLPKGHYFGRNQLFLKSLHLHKKMKHRRSKKCRLDHKKIMKDKVQEDINSDDQATSTSTSGRSDLAFMSSSKKRSRSSSDKECKRKNDVKYSDDDFDHNLILNRDSKNDVTVDTRGRPRMPLNSTGNPYNGMEADASSKDVCQNGVLSLLIGLKSKSVPRWDDMERPPFQSHDLVNVQHNNIGYVLDEWDEEYDKGKRKKVKQCKRSFGGPNLFQETANLKIQEKTKMKVKCIGSGNQPFRI